MKPKPWCPGARGPCPSIPHRKSTEEINKDSGRVYFQSVKLLPTIFPSFPSALLKFKKNL
jgi:hypothetical protein